MCCEGFCEILTTIAMVIGFVFMAIAVIVIALSGCLSVWSWIKRVYFKAE